jgi:hypothetical protein
MDESPKLIAQWKMTLCALLRADQRLTEGLRKAGVPEGKAKAN